MNTISSVDLCGARSIAAKWLDDQLLDVREHLRRAKLRNQDDHRPQELKIQRKIEMGTHGPC